MQGSPNFVISKDLINGKPLYRRTPNNSGRFAAPPTLIVMHYTAGGSGKLAADFLCQSSTQASAHIVIDRDGTPYQILPFNEVAWHAGPSTWRGRQYCNQYSIGIEIANYGFAHKRADGKYYNAYDGVMDSNLIIDAAHKNGGGVMGWEIYPADQLNAVEALTRALLLAYPSINDIAGHDDVAPAIKVDPGPAFPMQRFKNLLSAPRSAGAAFASPQSADVSAATEATAKVAKREIRKVIASALNVRGGPGTSHEVMHSFGPLPYGTRVAVIQDAGDWAYIEVISTTGQPSGNKGWVFDQYLAFET